MDVGPWAETSKTTGSSKPFLVVLDILMAMEKLANSSAQSLALITHTLTGFNRQHFHEQILVSQSAKPRKHRALDFLMLLDL